MSRRKPVGGSGATRVLLTLLVTALAGVVARGQEPTPSTDPAATARELIGEPSGVALSGARLEEATDRVTALMRCPQCQALSVADSPTPTSIAMRAEARTLLESGYTEAEVLEYFERSYGEFIRLSPKATGFNLVVWLLPIAALLAGAWFVGARIRRAAAAGGGSPTLGPEDELAVYAERVRREVAGAGD